MSKEKDLKRLEEIASLLNEPKTGLDEAVSLFEEGVQLIKQNYEEIKKASGKIVELKKELEAYSEVKFDAE